ncbi:MAG: hypothetical protein R3F39_17115 [Myxococcota bacterium]
MSAQPEHQQAGPQRERPDEGRAADEQAGAGPESVYGNAMTSREGARPDLGHGTPWQWNAAVVTQLEAELTGAGTNPAQIPYMCGRLGDADKAPFRARLGEIAGKCTGEDTIIAARALGGIGVTDRVTAYQTANPAPPAVRLSEDLRGVSDVEVAELCNDAGRVTWLKGILAGSPAIHLPVTRILFGDMMSRPHLASWLAERSTPLMAAMAFGTMHPDIMAATLTTAGAWGWLDGLDGGDALDDGIRRELTDFEPHVAGATLAKIQALTVTGDREAITEADALTRLPALLDGADALDAANLLHLCETAGAAALPLLNGNAARRTRATSIMSADQAFQVARAVGFELPETLRWLQAAGGATPEHVMAASMRANEAQWQAVFADATLAGQFATMSGGAPPAAMLADYAGQPWLITAIVGTPALLTWYTAGSAPHEILGLFEGTADHVAAVIAAFTAAAVGWAWVGDLTPGRDRENRTLRMLQIQIPDATARDHIKYWLQEDVHSTAPSNTVVPIDPATRRSPLEELETAATAGTLTAADALSWLGEMSAADRAAVAAHATLLPAVLSPLNAAQLLRATELLALTATQLIDALNPALMTTEYSAVELVLAAAPAAEQQAIASHPARFDKLTTATLAGTLNVLTALRTPAVLAAAGAANWEVARQISVSHEPIEAWTALTQDAATQAMVAGQIDAHEAAMLEHLPSGAALPAPLRTALTAVRDALTVASARTAMEAVLGAAAGSRPTDESAQAQTAVAGMALWDAVDALVAASGVDSSNFQSLASSASAADALALFVSHPTQAQHMRDRLFGSPFVCFPALGSPPPDAFWTPLAIAWVIDDHTATDALTRLTANAASTAAFSTWLDTAAVERAPWLAAMPRSPGLTTAERAAVKAIFDRSTVVEVAVTLSEIRWGCTFTGTPWTLDDLARVWVVMDALPDPQAEGNAVLQNYNRLTTTGGSWDETTGTVNLGMGDTAHVGAFYEDQTWGTKAVTAAALGITEAQVDGRVADGRLETRTNGAGVAEFRVAEVRHAYYAHTILHEVGHSVDTMLGSHTDIVYNQAGWFVYATGQAEQWVDAMSGWGGISAPHKQQMVGLLDQRLASSTEIGGPSGAALDLVPSTHAAHLPANAAVPIVQHLGSAPDAFMYTNPVRANGKVFSMNHYYRRWMSCSERALEAQVRDYSLFAPEEWFADAYAEYYRLYDGSPATDAMKGGNLPAWVKQWFDANVDAIGRDPHVLAP